MTSLEMDTESVNRDGSKGLRVLRATDSESTNTVTDITVTNSRYIADFIAVYDGSAAEVLNADNVVRESGKFYIDSATVGTSYYVDYLSPDIRVEIATIMGDTNLTFTGGSDKQAIRIDKLVRIIENRLHMAHAQAMMAVGFSLGLACAAGTYDISTIPDVYAEDDTPSNMFVNFQDDIMKAFVIVP